MSHIPTVVLNLNINLHVSGWISDPKATIYYKPSPSSNKTVKFFLTDQYGNVLTDEYTTIFNAGLEYKTYNLGDWISAQRQSKNLTPGLYLLITKIVEDNMITASPIYLSEIATSIPADPDNVYLEHIAVIDKVTGSLIKYPPSVNVIPLDPRYMVYLYYHKGNKGRLVKLNEVGGKEWDSGYHRFGKVEFRLKFNSMRDIAIYMLQRSYGIHDKLLREVINNIELGNIADALKILKIHYRGFATSLGRTTIEIDTTKNELVETTFIYLGQFDWAQALAWGGFGCGLGILGAVILSISTLGTGSISIPLAAGMCLGGGMVTASAYVITSGSSKGDSTIIKDAEKSAEEGKNQIDQEVKDLQELLNQLKDQGKLTQEDVDKILEHVNKIKETSFRVIDELVEDVKKAYSEGYNKGVSDSKMWIIGAGVGGLIVGALITK